MFRELKVGLLVEHQIPFECLRPCALAARAPWADEETLCPSIEESNEGIGEWNIGRRTELGNSRNFLRL